MSNPTPHNQLKAAAKQAVPQGNHTVQTPGLGGKATATEKETASSVSCSVICFERQTHTHRGGKGVTTACNSMTSFHTNTAQKHTTAHYCIARCGWAHSKSSQKGLKIYTYNTYLL